MKKQKQQFKFTKYFFLSFILTATIEFFKETLPPQLLQRIYGGEMIPETLSRWYKKAALQEQIR